MPQATAPTVPAAAKPKRRIWLWVLLIVAGLIVVTIAGLISLGALIASSGTSFGRSSVAGIAQNAMMKSGSVSMGLTAAPSVSYDMMAESAGDSYAARTVMMPPEEPRSGATAAEVDQKIIKNGSLTMVVENVADASAKIVAAAAARGGYTQNSTVSERADGTHTGYITVRVPASDFEALMAEAKTFALTVKNESANGQDVTEQYTDLEAQLHNAQAQEQTYLAVLEKAKSVEEILKVQDYLGRIRGTIESLQGRLKYLQNVTSYSTINITLEEEPKIQVPTKEFRPASELKAAVQALVASLQGLVVSAIWLVIVGGGTLIPLALIIWLLVIIIKKLLHRKKKLN